jgi:hypothetical protein
MWFSGSQAQTITAVTGMFWISSPRLWNTSDNYGLKYVKIPAKESMVYGGVEY